MTVQPNPDTAGTQDNTNVPPADSTATETKEGALKDSLTDGDTKPDATPTDDGGDKKDGSLLDDDADTGDETDKETADDKPTEPEGAPDDYGEFEVTKDFEMPEELYKSFTEFGKKHNLSKDVMQDIVNLDIDRQSKDAESTKQTEEAATEARKQEESGWVDQTKKKYGDKFDEALSLVDKAYNTFAGDAVKKIFKDSGVNKHPEIFDFFHKVASAMSEDVLVKGERKGGSEEFNKLTDIFPQPKSESATDN